MTEMWATGRCMCGSVSYSAATQPKWTALCHCESCRRSAAAPVVAWMGFERDQVVWSGERSFFKSSEKALRGFCGVCGTQISFESTAWPGGLHLYALSLDDPTLYEPQLHCHAREQLPWLHIRDDLPRFDATAEVPAK